MSSGGTCGKVLFTICGPKCSLTCLILSVWGVIMLALLGIFFQIEAVALFEDIEPALKHLTCERGSEGCYEGPFENVQYYSQTDVQKAYQSAAASCYGAAALYAFFTVLSGTFVGINFWRAKVGQS